MTSLEKHQHTKTGWPWDQQVKPDIYTTEVEWPKISVITPSFNQGAYLEQTIRSILFQNYPNLEYIIIDAGSTDETLRIIERYASHLTYWVSEKDNGQSHAINKGLAISTGELLTWLNSDDFFEPLALKVFAEHFLHKEADFYQGQARIIDTDGNELWKMEGAPFDDLHTKFYDVQMPQPASMFTRAAYEKYGPIDESLNFSMDMDFWLKILAGGGRFVKVPKLLSNFRMHPISKTSGGTDNFVIDLLSKYSEARFTSKEKSILQSSFIESVIKDHEKHLLTYGRLTSRKTFKVILKILKKDPGMLRFIPENISKRARFNLGKLRRYLQTAEK